MKRKFNHFEKESYYSRLSFAGNKLGSNVPIEKVSYSRSWLLGAGYAQSVELEGKSVTKDKEYIRLVRNKKNLSVGEKAFLDGCNSYHYDDK